MSDLLPKITWADQLLEGADPGDCGPYVVNDNLRRLMVLGEIHAQPEGGYPFSDGFQVLPGGRRIWAGPGMVDMFRNKKIGLVRAPENEDLGAPSDWFELQRLYATGEGFPYEGDFYLLPNRKYRENMFTHHPPGRESFTTFVGYRGHAHPFPTVLTPSALRHIRPGEVEPYLAYKRVEGYATNLLREAYLRLRDQPLLDLQAVGILQHHHTIGATDVLDLTYDIEVAKLFALVDFEPLSDDGQIKEFRGEDDYSSVFQIVVRSLGRDQPMDLPPPYQGRLQLLPYNVFPLSVVTESADRERGFGVSGFGPDDMDNYGTVLNITEWRYHPRSNPEGWDAIGGVPDVQRLAPATWAEKRRLLGLAPDAHWLEDLLSDVRQRVWSRFPWWQATFLND
ncbi:hypothetical protein ACQP2F_18085 [Actinoplanes sp. CA-030573]|uniref:hypothetical protein n=1 Tax=Actinoplanes sp. CA-030573 TaxID=3239898 RepID=UPI003D8FDAF7